MGDDARATSGAPNGSQDPIAEILARLRKYPHADVESGKGSVTVLPIDAEGFEVRFEVQAEGYLVSCLGWHEDFDNVEDAMSCFGFALSTTCRLKVTSRGATAYQWQMQSLVDGQWVEYSVVGLLQFPFWARQKVEFRQNRLLESPEDWRPSGGA